MFHHKNSSKCWQQTLQINLLQPKDRDSHIKITRAHHLPHHQHPAHQKPAHPRLSSSLPRQQQPDQCYYDTYSVQNKVDFSESLLTRSNENSVVVGVLLFGLMLGMEGFEIMGLCLGQRWVGIQGLWGMLGFLGAAETAAFGVLYYFQWVQSPKIIIHFLRPSPSKRPNHPFLTLFLTTILTLIWQLSYSNSLLHNKSPPCSHLILFYYTILPEILGYLLFEDDVHRDTRLKGLFWGAIIYVIGYGVVVDFWMGIGGAIGGAVMWASVRFGRAVVVFQYVIKMVISIVACTMVFLSRNQPSAIPTTTSIPQIMLLLIFGTLGIILVRCINNKILRTELYKYYYVDYEINSSLLLLPILYGYIDNHYIDVPIGIVGTALFLIVSILVGRRNSRDFSIDQVYQDRDRDLKEKYTDSTPRDI